MYLIIKSSECSVYGYNQFQYIQFQLNCFEIGLIFNVHIHFMLKIKKKHNNT